MTILTLGEIARMVDGHLTGDAALEIAGATILRDVRSGEITFVDRIELLAKALESPAAALLVTKDIQINDFPHIQVADVHRAFGQIIAHFAPPVTIEKVGISPKAIVSESASLGDDVQVHPGATIGDDVVIGARSVIHSGAHVMAGCRIGTDVLIFPGAVLYEKTEVGARSIIHANAVIGAYGYGYELVDGRHVLSAQLGHVIIESDVEVGATTTIDRGTYGPTVIGEGTKIDNMVQIAHNCIIGRHNILCSQVGIAGSTTTGDYVVMGGQVGVRDHVHIGANTTLGAKAGVMNDIPSGQVYFGSPATHQRQQKLQLASITKLPELRRTVKRLEKTLARLEQNCTATAAAKDANE